MRNIDVDNHHNENAKVTEVENVDQKVLDNIVNSNDIEDHYEQEVEKENENEEVRIYRTIVLNNGMVKETDRNTYLDTADDHGLMVDVERNDIENNLIVVAVYYKDHIV